MVVATTNNPSETNTMNKLLLGGLALAAVVAAPAVSLGAMYAYVNTSGEVMSTEASSASAALGSAPMIHVRSGVMLIETGDDLVGDKVSGT